MAAIFQNGGYKRSELDAELYLSRKSCSKSMKLAEMLHLIIRSKFSKDSKLKKIKMAAIFKISAMKYRNCMKKNYAMLSQKLKIEVKA